MVLCYGVLASLMGLYWRCPQHLPPSLYRLLPLPCLLCSLCVLRIRLLSLLLYPGLSSPGKASYGDAGGIICKKIMPVNTIQNVPIANKSNNPAVSSGNANPEIVVNRNALNPNPLNGNAVAVPRCLGQFVAQTFKLALNAEQLPTPVKNPKKHSHPKLYPFPPA